MSKSIKEKEAIQGQHYFICGNDDFLVDREGRKIYTQHSASLPDDFSTEIINAEAQNVAKVESVIKQFIESAQMPSLFGGKKVIWLRAVNFLADTPTGRAEGTKIHLESLVEVLSKINYKDIDIIITASPVDKRTRIFKALKNTVHFYPMEENENLGQIIAQECQSQGVKITQDAIESLLLKVNNNSRLLMQEIQKLVTFVGENGTIDQKLIHELVSQFGENDFFEFSEAFFSLDINRTLTLLTQHFYTQKEARSLLSSLLNKLRLMIPLRSLLDGHSIDSSSYSINKNTLQKLAEEYGFPFGEAAQKNTFNLFNQNPWYLGKLASLVKKIPLKNLINFEFLLIKAFEDILEYSQAHEQEAIMHQLVVQCLAV